MQIVIDIPQQIYDLLQITDYIECQDRNLANDILKRIKNGTPLQEHCEGSCPYYPTESEDD